MKRDKIELISRTVKKTSDDLVYLYKGIVDRYNTDDWWTDTTQMIGGQIQHMISEQRMTNRDLISSPKWLRSKTD